MGSLNNGALEFNKEKRKNIKFSDDSMQIVQKIIKNYPEGKQKSALLPVLHVAQAEFDGWLSQ
jgi:NADH-quinone oxidoreductase subunit E